MPPWEFEHDGEVVKVDPAGPLLVSIGGATNLSVDAAIAGLGIVYLFEDWLRPYFDRGLLVPILEPWWQRFSGPLLYYPGRRLVPAPLRAFIDFIKATASNAGASGRRPAKAGANPVRRDRREARARLERGRHGRAGPSEAKGKAR
jgi:hypothetical protein